MLIISQWKNISILYEKYFNLYIFYEFNRKYWSFRGDFGTHFDR